LENSFDGWKIIINSHHAPLSEYYQSWTLFIFSSVYFLTVGVTAANWVYKGVFLDINMKMLIILSFVGRSFINDHWDLSLRSIIESGNEVVWK